MLIFRFFLHDMFGERGYFRMGAPIRIYHFDAFLFPFSLAGFLNHTEPRDLQMTTGNNGLLVHGALAP